MANTPMLVIMLYKLSLPYGQKIWQLFFAADKFYRLYVFMVIPYRITKSNIYQYFGTIHFRAKLRLPIFQAMVYIVNFISSGMIKLW